MMLAVGTANFTNPYACPQIIKDSLELMNRYEIQDLASLRYEVAEEIRS